MQKRGKKQAMESSPSENALLTTRQLENLYSSHLDRCVDVKGAQTEVYQQDLASEGNYRFQVGKNEQGVFCVRAFLKGEQIAVKTAVLEKIDLEGPVERTMNEIWKKFRSLEEEHAYVMGMKEYLDSSGEFRIKALEDSKVRMLVNNFLNRPKRKKFVSYVDGESSSTKPLVYRVFKPGENSIALIVGIGNAQDSKKFTFLGQRWLNSRNNKLKNKLNKSKISSIDIKNEGKLM